MRKPVKRGARRERRIAASDVGRFLKQLAGTMKDPVTGNPAMAEALLNLSTILIDAKLVPVEKAASDFLDQGGFDFDDGIDFSELSSETVQRILGDETFTRAHLVILGTERLGITRSRLEKLPKEEIIRVISSALQHEESLRIISEEARRGATSRAS